MNMRFGMRLRRLREARGWTQAALARRVDVTEPYISMLETGAKCNPTLALVKKLARALGVTLAELVE